MTYLDIAKLELALEKLQEVRATLGELEPKIRASGNVAGRGATPFAEELWTRLPGQDEDYFRLLVQELGHFLAARGDPAVLRRHADGTMGTELG
ncbi:MAG: hypothetical protein ACREQM_09675 [Candidatus Dormibacteraceae bacterium]